jgi:hypothetical protein
MSQDLQISQKVIDTYDQALRPIAEKLSRQENQPVSQVFCAWGTTHRASHPSSTICWEKTSRRQGWRRPMMASPLSLMDRRENPWMAIP